MRGAANEHQRSPGREIGRGGRRPWVGALAGVAALLAPGDGMAAWDVPEAASWTGVWTVASVHRLATEAPGAAGWGGGLRLDVAHVDSEGELGLAMHMGGALGWVGRAGAVADLHAALGSGVHAGGLMLALVGGGGLGGTGVLGGDLDASAGPYGYLLARIAAPLGGPALLEVGWMELTRPERRLGVRLALGEAGEPAVTVGAEWHAFDGVADLLVVSFGFGAVL